MGRRHWGAGRIGMQSGRRRDHHGRQEYNGYYRDIRPNKYPYQSYISSSEQSSHAGTFKFGYAPEIKMRDVRTALLGLIIASLISGCDAERVRRRNVAVWNETCSGIKFDVGNKPKELPVDIYPEYGADGLVSGANLYFPMYLRMEMMRNATRDREVNKVVKDFADDKDWVAEKAEQNRINTAKAHDKAIERTVECTRIIESLVREKYNIPVDPLPVVFLKKIQEACYHRYEMYRREELAKLVVQHNLGNCGTLSIYVSNALSKLKRPPKSIQMVSINFIGGTANHVFLLLNSKMPNIEVTKPDESRQVMLNLSKYGGYICDPWNIYFGNVAEAAGIFNMYSVNSPAETVTISTFTPPPSLEEVVENMRI